MAETALRLLALLGTKPGSAQSNSGKESSGKRTGPPDQRDADAIAGQLRRVAALEGIGGDAGSEAHLTKLAASLVDQAQKAVAVLEGGAAAGSLRDAQWVALESVIRTRGRPALAVQANGLEDLDDLRHPGSGFWRIPVGDHEVQLVKAAAASGAVIVRDRARSVAIVVGTAWLIGGNRVVTNRHVLLPPIGRALVDRNPTVPTEAELKADLELVVDFAYYRGAPRDGTVTVAGVPYITQATDPVDVAIMRLAAAPATATPLTLTTTAMVSRQLFLVGHPGVLSAVPKEVQAVFGTPDGGKRVCLGEVLAEGAANGEIAHDASTIGGFSGASLQAFGGTGVSALHFFGDPALGNRAITADALRTHDVGGFFRV